MPYIGMMIPHIVVRNKKNCKALKFEHVSTRPQKTCTSSNSLTSFYQFLWFRESILLNCPAGRFSFPHSEVTQVSGSRPILQTVLSHEAVVFLL